MAWGLAPLVLVEGTSSIDPHGTTASLEKGTNSINKRLFSRLPNALLTYQLVGSLLLRAIPDASLPSKKSDTPNNSVAFCFLAKGD